MKKLQGLTTDYKDMLESEERAKRTQAQLRDTEQQIDSKLHKLEVEKSHHAAELV